MARRINWFAGAGAGADGEEKGRLYDDMKYIRREMMMKTDLWSSGGGLSCV